MSKDRSEEIRRFDGPLRGQALFAIVFLVASALLLSQLGNETNGPRARNSLLSRASGLPFR